MPFSIPRLITLALASTLVSATCIPRDDATPTLPLNEVAAENTGTAALPHPSGPPKYIALGLGFQNYTCSATTSSPSGTYVQTKTSDGAVANLYNIQPELSSKNIDSLTPDVLMQFEDCLSSTHCDPRDPTISENAITGDCELCHQVAVLSVVPWAAHKVGLHFFAPNPNSGAQAPHFALDKYGAYLSAAKVGDVKAPASAYAGAQGEGAVDWLYLDAAANDPYTKNLKGVYRVETAGGNAPKSCSPSDPVQIAVPYAAQYWFYD